MTTLNFALSRAAARDWRSGDRIVLTRLDHDANVAPWLELAHDRDFLVDVVDVTDDGRLDMADLRSKVGERTRVVAFTAASNVIGTLTPVREIAALAHSVGALAWVDAVHYAPHERIDAGALDADVLLCSAYKFCGPHLGLAFVRKEAAEGWRPYKARPAPIEPFARRFQTGTPPFELLAGFNATIAYLDSLGGVSAIRGYERGLGERLVSGLPDRATMYGQQTMTGRVPTFLLNVAGVEAAEAARRLCAEGFGVWAHGSYYAPGLHERLGWDEAIRVGLAHYNTIEEVDLFLTALDAL